MLVKLEDLITQLDDRYKIIAGTVNGADAQNSNDNDRDAIEYLYFKLLYKKAKTLRKTRMLQSSDELCQLLIDLVKE